MTRARLGFVAAVAIVALPAFVAARQAPEKPPVTQASPDDFIKGAVKAKTPGLVNPEVVRRVNPKYTPEAMRAKIQGTVRLEIVVETDGTVRRARVVESLDKSLDEQAIKAAKHWEFTPGTLNGKPVACLVGLNLEFRLH